MKTAFIAALCVVFFSVNAEARQRHKLHPECNVTMPCIAPYASTPDQVRVARGRYIAREMGIGAAIERPRRKVGKSVSYRRGGGAEMAVFSPVIAEKPLRSSASAAAPSSAIGKPMRYIAGRLICAINVGAALAERGIKGTGSALALSYLKWGRSAGGPVPGAVIVSARRGGGHVAIVSRVENGVVFAWNATGGQRGWREIAYRQRVIDYRVPG